MREISRPEPVKLNRDFYQKSWEVYALLREEGPVREVVLPDGVVAHQGISRTSAVSPVERILEHFNFFRHGNMWYPYL
jgi:hypothetical protein